MRVRSTAAALATLLALSGGAAVAAGLRASPRHRSHAGLASALTPRQMAGERVIYSYPGLTPPPSLIAQISAGDAAGVVLFKSNIANDVQIRRVIAELQAAAARSPVKTPLLIMTDQEGGEVRRLSGQPLLSEKQIGQSADPAAQARLAGRGAALNLRHQGINVNLAPVLDVFRRPGNFIDRYQRSYGDSAGAVAQLGADFIRAQQHAGVAATAKHFPGLGAAGRNQDTDLAPVSLSVPLARLRSIDELPYGAAIAAHVKLVMVSWAVYPALDPRRPAGLSSVVVQRELRQRLGFRGVTVTDALEAGALRAYGSTAKRAVLAAGAGMDLLLCAGQHVNQGIAAVKALARGLADRQLDGGSFAASVARVLALRRSLGR